MNNGMSVADYAESSEYAFRLQQEMLRKARPNQTGQGNAAPPDSVTDRLQRVLSLLVATNSALDTLENSPQPAMPGDEPKMSGLLEALDRIENLSLRLSERTGSLQQRIGRL